MFIKHPNDRKEPMHPAEREAFYEKLNGKKGKKAATEVVEETEEETEPEEEVEAPVRTARTPKTAAQKKAAATKKAAKK